MRLHGPFAHVVGNGVRDVIDDQRVDKVHDGVVNALPKVHVGRQPRPHLRDNGELVAGAQPGGVEGIVERHGQEVDTDWYLEVVAHDGATVDGGVNNNPETSIMHRMGGCTGLHDSFWMGDLFCTQHRWAPENTSQIAIVGTILSQGAMLYN